MRKLLLFISFTICTTGLFAQRTHVSARTLSTVYGSHNTERTTGIGDTLTMTNTNDTNTVVLYQSDSGGYVTGTDFWGDQGFAELYNINGNDSGVTVLGLIAQFGGSYNPSSPLYVTFNIWSVSLPRFYSTSYLFSGFPDQVIDSVEYPITQLGIGVGGAADTMKLFLFPDSTLVELSQSFYAGYTINYSFSSLNGDTIGLASTLNGDRDTPAYTVNTYVDASSDTITDTLIYVQNCTQWSDGNWYDNYTQDDSLFNDLIIYPVVLIDTPTSVKGITRKSLTLFGVSPNPVTSQSYVSCALNTSTSLTLQVLDMTGKVLASETYDHQSNGSHQYPLPITQLTPGTYSCLLRTGQGDGIATLFTVK